MRSLAAILLLQFLTVLIAPAFVVADFIVERGHIVRDLCVQRMVPEAERTCHGDCCLKKRLDESGERELNMPTELRALQFGKLLADRGAKVPVPDAKEATPAWGILTEGPLAGHLRSSAPVPWC